VRVISRRLLGAKIGRQIDAAAKTTFARLNVEQETMLPMKLGKLKFRNVIKLSLQPMANKNKQLGCRLYGHSIHDTALLYPIVHLFGIST
jgi:hypothetical protein